MLNLSALDTLGKEASSGARQHGAGRRLVWGKTGRGLRESLAQCLC
jgi:hypothetical protein